MNISINAPSYLRADGVTTLSYLPFCRLWVCETEADDYRRLNAGAEVVECEKGIQGSRPRVMNHILDTEFERGIDVVVIIDDDYQYMGYHEGGMIHVLEADDFVDWVEKYSVVADEIGARIWGVNLTPDAQMYLEHIPFSLKSVTLGPFTAHLKHPIRFDERFTTKNDYDFAIQHLNRYRRILRLNKFFYVNKMGGSGTGQTGGCAKDRNLVNEMRLLKLLVDKWGSQIVRYDLNFDRSHLSKRRRQFDINPVVRVPIKGV